MLETTGPGISIWFSSSSIGCVPRTQSFGTEECLLIWKLAQLQNLTGSKMKLSLPGTGLFPVSH